MDRNLRAFLSVADCENLTAAADKLGLSQPSLTKRLQKLEESVGGRLFERLHRGMTLTSAGKAYYKRAKIIESEYLYAQEEVQSITTAGLDVLRIGAGPLFHMRYLSPVVAQLHREFPSLQIVLRADVSEQSFPMLLERELDLLLGVVDDTKIDERLEAIPMATVEYGIVSVKKEKRNQSHKNILGEQSWILYGEHKNTEQWLKDYFMANDLGVPNVVLRTSAFSAGLQLVQEGGFAMIAPMLLKPVVDTLNLSIEPADPPVAKRECGAYVRASSKGFGAVRRFLTLLEEEFNVLAD